MARKGKVCREE